MSESLAREQRSARTKRAASRSCHGESSAWERVSALATSRNHTAVSTRQQRGVAQWTVVNQDVVDQEWTLDVGGRRGGSNRAGN